MLAKTMLLLRSSRNLLGSLRFAQSASLFADKGLFGFCEVRTPADFKTLNETVRKRAQLLVDKIVGGKCEKKTVAVLDDLSNEICCAADMAECVRNLHTSDAFRLSAEESMRDFTQLIESFNTRLDLYQAIKDSLENERDSLSSVDKQTLAMFLNDFEQSGVHLSVDKKQQFLKLNDEIFVAGSAFTHGAERSAKVSHSHSRIYRTKHYITSANTMAVSRAARRWSYSTYYNHSDEQEKCLKQLIASRHHLARCTGFTTYAHRAQQNTLLGSYESAHEFVIGIIKACQPAAQLELSVLENVLMQCESAQNRLCESDLHYLCFLYRERAFGSLHHLSKYFSFDNMLIGFGLLTKRLYDVSFVVSKPDDGEVWPANIVKIDVMAEESRFLGTIYIDVQKRNNKSVGDCHFTVRCAKKLDDGSFQTPIVVLSLSLTDKVEGTDEIYMSTQEAENFFHEMGHAMHSMLGQTEYQHTAGTRCPTDMAEIPSNLMEYFFNNVDVLRLIAKDAYGRSISVEDAASLITSRFAFTSIEMLQQTVHSLFDLQIHGNNAQAIINGRYTTTDLYSSIWSTVFPTVEKEVMSAWHHRFTHLIPYGSKYYSYLVARAAASLIWNTCFRNDPFSKESGHVIKKILSKGGSVPSADLLHIALNYSPNSQNLAAALKDEADHTCQRFAVSI